MNLIFACVGAYQWMFDCIKGARARSGCDVHVVNTIDNIVDGSHFCPLANIAGIPQKVIETNTLFQVRWMMVNHIVNKLGLNGPFYCPDWDIMILHNVVDHIRAMSSFGMLYTMDNGHCGSAAHVIRDANILKAYVEFLQSYAVNVKEAWQLSDMYTWHMFCRDNQIPIANLSEEFCGGVFDHNIHTGGDVWETDEVGRKRIEWHDYKPYFVRRSDGKRIKAEAIHCWHTYKNKTSELLAHAGLL